MSSKNTSVSAESARQTVAKSNASAFEKSLESKAIESLKGEPYRLSIDFLKSIKEVTAIRSKYKSDKCFARITFRNNKYSSVPLDYDVPAEPGDKLRVGTLKWVDITTSEGSVFTAITGEIQ